MLSVLNFLRTFDMDFITTSLNSQKDGYTIMNKPQMDFLSLFYLMKFI